MKQILLIIAACLLCASLAYAASGDVSGGWYSNFSTAGSSPSFTDKKAAACVKGNVLLTKTHILLCYSSGSGKYRRFTGS